jgi:membrane protease YdiL (CAAX protease family)
LALLLLDALDLTIWAILVTASGLVLALILSSTGPRWHASVDGGDLFAVIALYAVVVALFRLAFVVFTTDNVWGLFLAFAGGLVIGVVGPIIYQVWLRGRDLESLGVGLHRLPETMVVGLIFGFAQFSMTMWGYRLPEAEAWVPVLVMSLVVGFFEAVFFRGFIQNRLEASFGTGAGVAGAAVLYSLYHVGYGMGFEEMWFLLGLGVVYAVVFRLVGNVLVLWPLLTPLGAFFNNLEAGDMELPWASIAGFADVGMIMAAAVWVAHRRIRKRRTPIARTPRHQPVELVDAGTP